MAEAERSAVALRSMPILVAKKPRRRWGTRQRLHIAAECDGVRLCVYGSLGWRADL
jgi:hypothetical protein